MEYCQISGNLDFHKNNNIIVDANGLFICPFCNRSFKALAYHTRQAHNVSGFKLRKMFGLPQNYRLETKELVSLRRKRALENSMDLQLIRTGVSTRFVKGVKLSDEMKNKISEGHRLDVRRIVI